MMGAIALFRLVNTYRQTDYNHNQAWYSCVRQESGSLLQSDSLHISKECIHGVVCLKGRAIRK